MTNETTIGKLHELRLHKMADSFLAQMEDSSFAGLSFEERVGLVVDSEWANRRNISRRPARNELCRSLSFFINRLTALIRKAGLHFSNAAIEDIEYHADRKLEKKLITELSTCNYILERHNVIILGATGSGKTYLGCAFGISACRNFHTVKYIRLPEILEEFAMARGNGNFPKVIQQYKRVDLLILDEWLLTPLTSREASDLLELVESRHKKASTIFCSQFSPHGWHEKIGEGTIAEAVLDRIVYDSHSIMIDGTDSMRKKKGIMKAK